MHKRLFLVVSFVLTLNGFIHASDSQEPAIQVSTQESPKTEELKRFEVKLDLIWALASTLKVGGEYWLDGRNALAIMALYNFSTKPDYQGEILASYKLYFLKFRRGPWLFVEPNLGYIKGYYECFDWSSDSDCSYSQISDPPKKYHAFAIGLAGGIKFFIPQTNTGLEAIAGLNRLYGSKDMEVAPNVGFSLVRRF